jgi:hypothetical protein
MAFGLLLPMRIAQFVFAIIVVGLSAYGMDIFPIKQKNI